MNQPIKYPVGVQTFSKLRENGYFYVDKTALLHKLVTNEEYVFLSRPRRFGKSLLMSTLEAYFKGRKDLFTGLAISELETEWMEYPVFHLDLSGANFNSPEVLVAHISMCLDNIEEDYSLSSDGDISRRFKQLIRRAYKKYGKQVVILIDEYDKPMLDYLHDLDIHENLKAELRGFYSGIKSSDEYIKFAMLSGITKFGKVSIFSGLNNLTDISLLPDYNAICGISESEFHSDFENSINSFANKYGLPTDEVWGKFKRMYDGYHFANEGEDIYNPYSVLSAFKQGKLSSFWYDTGSPSYLVRLVQTNSYSLDHLEGEKRTEIQLSNITDMEYDIVPLLYQSGYLTIKGYDAITDEYTLGFPNREVNKAFWESLAYHFFRRKRGGGNAFDVREFLNDLENGHPNEFMERMKSLFADTNSETEMDKEIHFQNMMAIASKLIGLTVRTEVHSSAGRCDMQILTYNYVYIFEFKINSSPEKALAQIYEKGYARPFGSDRRKVFLIGADFSTKSRTLEGWLIDTPRH